MILEGMMFPIVTLIVLCTAMLIGIRESRNGKVPQIRQLAAVDAIDEYIGRSVEMGRPVHFSAGVGNLSV